MNPPNISSRQEPICRIPNPRNESLWLQLLLVTDLLPNGFLLDADYTTCAFLDRCNQPPSLPESSQTFAWTLMSNIHFMLGFRIIRAFRQHGTCPILRFRISHRWASFQYEYGKFVSFVYPNGFLQCYQNATVLEYQTKLQLFLYPCGNPQSEMVGSQLRNLCSLTSDKPGLFDVPPHKF